MEERCDRDHSSRKQIRSDRHEAPLKDLFLKEPVRQDLPQSEGHLCTIVLGDD
jgi:hypothetical protein